MPYLKTEGQYRDHQVLELLVADENLLQLALQLPGQQAARVNDVLRMLF